MHNKTTNPRKTVWLGVRVEEDLAAALVALARKRKVRLAVVHREALRKAVSRVRGAA